MAKKSTTSRKRKQAPKTAKRSQASRKKPSAKKAPEKRESKPKPKTAPASLARRKAALIGEVKADHVDPARAAEIRSELDSEPLASIPILSYDELRRLGD